MGLNMANEKWSLFESTSEESLKESKPSPEPDVLEVEVVTVL